MATKKDVFHFNTFVRANWSGEEFRVCLNCHPQTQHPGLILFPALGTPSFVSASQKTIKVYVVLSSLAGDKMKKLSLEQVEVWGVEITEDMRAAYKRGVMFCGHGHILASQHLRVSKFGEKNTKELIGAEGTQMVKGGVGGSDPNYSQSQKNIIAFYLGKFEAGNVKNRDGEIVGTLDTKTVQWYKDAAQNLSCDLDGIYEFEINADFLDINGSVKNISWMISPPMDKQSKDASLRVYKNLSAFPGIFYSDNATELGDLILHYALGEMGSSRSDKCYLDSSKLFLSETNQMAMRERTQPTLSLMGIKKALRTWHPVVRKAADLRIGHISDPHLNSRHYTLTRPSVPLLEGAGAAEVSKSGAESFPQKLCHAYIAADKLMEQLADDSDAIFITGDVHDCNRELHPEAVRGNKLSEIWKACNLFNNFGNRTMYVSGISHLLIYTMIVKATRSGAPCAFVNGNHEPYRLQYGMSPRSGMGTWSFWRGAIDKYIRPAVKGVGELTDTLLNKPYTPLWAVGATYKFFTGNRLETGWGKDDDLTNKQGKGSHLGGYGASNAEKASAWSSLKADIGIPGDHNLTPYEAILVYGPSYANAPAPINFHKEWFDWVYYILTPWQNWYFEHNGSTYAGLGWGDIENFTSLAHMFVGGDKNMKDKQGFSFLSRSTTSIDNAQKAILEQALANKGKNAFLFSHFTMVSYKAPVGFFVSPEDPNKAAQKVNSRGFCPMFLSPGIRINLSYEQAGWNDVNDGTCETNLDWFYRNCVAYAGKEMEDGKKGAATNPPKAFTAHFCGHSHRAGVYTLNQTGRVVQLTTSDEEGVEKTHEIPQTLPIIKVADCCDPKELPTAVAKGASEATKFVVTSSGGIMGKQNFFGELMGWTWLKPSALVYDKGTVTKIETDSDQPRLCVCMDYLHYDFDEDKKINVVPISFGDVKFTPSAKKPTVEVDVKLHPMLAALDCIDEVKIACFDGTKWDVVGSCNTATFKDKKVGSEELAENSGAKSKLTVGKTGKINLNTAALMKIPVPGAPSVPFDVNVSNTTANNSATGGSKKSKDNTAMQEGATNKVKFFGVVKFHAPKGYNGNLANIFDCSDDWIFPLSVDLVSGAASPDIERQFSIVRPKTEAGEIPDWKWLNAMDGTKYIIPKKIINPKQD